MRIVVYLGIRLCADRHQIILLYLKEKQINRVEKLFMVKIVRENQNNRLTTTRVWGGGETNEFRRKTIERNKRAAVEYARKTLGDKG